MNREWVYRLPVGLAAGGVDGVGAVADGGVDVVGAVVSGRWVDTVGAISCGGVVG